MSRIARRIQPITILRRQRFSCEGQSLQLITRVALILVGVGAAAVLMTQSAKAQLGSGSMRVTYFIAEGSPQTGYLRSDRELARRAFEVWAEHAAGALTWESASAEDDALVRLYWSQPGDQAFGEMRPLVVRGRRGAAVFVRADMSALGTDLEMRTRQDPLWRDTIVYLTCLHELGHALGLEHTAQFPDIMYFFGYGGDIAEYFGRFRRQLRSRDDIGKVSGLSQSDIARLHRLHPATVR